MWKFNWNMSKEKWLLVLAAGICLMLLAVPSGRQGNAPSAQTAAGNAPAGERPFPPGEITSGSWSGGWRSFCGRWTAWGRWR